MIDTTIILNVLIGMFLYNLILKSIGVAIVKSMLNTKAGAEASTEVRKKFKERLKEQENK